MNVDLQPILAPLVRIAVSEAVLQLVAEADRLSAHPQPISYGEREAAKQLGVPTSVLRDARTTGELTGSRLGRRVVYSRQELLRWLAAKEVSRTW